MILVLKKRRCFLYKTSVKGVSRTTFKSKVLLTNNGWNCFPCKKIEYSFQKHKQ